MMINVNPTKSSTRLDFQFASDANDNDFFTTWKFPDSFIFKKRPNRLCHPNKKGDVKMSVASATKSSAGKGFFRSGGLKGNAKVLDTTRQNYLNLIIPLTGTHKFEDFLGLTAEIIGRLCNENKAATRVRWKHVRVGAISKHFPYLAWASMAWREREALKGSIVIKSREIDTQNEQKVLEIDAIACNLPIESSLETMFPTERWAYNPALRARSCLHILRGRRRKIGQCIVIFHGVSGGWLASMTKYFSTDFSDNHRISDVWWTC